MKKFLVLTTNGDEKNFDPEIIKDDLIKINGGISSELTMMLLDEILEEIDDGVEENGIISSSEVRAYVEKVLMNSREYSLAKKYILLKKDKDDKKNEASEKILANLNNNELKIVKNDGTEELFEMSKLRRGYNKVAGDLKYLCPFKNIKDQIKKYINEGMKTSDINRLLVKSAIDLISLENTTWQIVAGRFAMMDIYKQASRNRGIPVKKLYSGKSYKEFFDNYIKKGHYYKDFYKYYSEEDILTAGEHINPETDKTYNFNTVNMFNKRYLLNPNKVVNELPQEMYMSVALFLAIPEKEETRLKCALEIYDLCSTQKISLPTPTLSNARTNFHQLSSCFVLNNGDDLNNIYHNVSKMAQISKFGGGIGTYLGNIRGRGAEIRGIEGASGGVLPWIKVVNDTAIAVNQLGTRAGAISVTLDIWHSDINDFFDIQTETGDIRKKSFDVFPAVSIPDLFMKRAEADAEWTTFEPNEVFIKTGIKLQDLFGKEFEEAYEKLEKNSKLKLKRTFKAKDIFKTYLKSVVETGMPYAFFRDTVNKLNPNKHAGNIYSSNLCHEIAQNAKAPEFVKEYSEDGIIKTEYKPGDDVVCNLATINLANVNTEQEIKRVAPIITRILDNVIDLNFYPTEESKLTSMKYRPVGIGYMGLAELLACKNFKYDSPEAVEYVDKLIEKCTYYSLKASNELSKERGSYELFKGSEWSKGILMGKDKDWFIKNSQMANKWIKLIDEVKEKGLRFGYNFSPAPNTGTALVCGTTAGMLPIYRKYFVETNGISPNVVVAPNLNKNNFWYYKEYTNMDMEPVIDMISAVQKWIDQSVSFEWMLNPQKVSPPQIYGYYFKAWRQGIKTVYYVRSMSMEVSECVSCSG